MLKSLGLNYKKDKIGFTTDTGSCFWVSEEEACQVVGAFGLHCYKQSNTEKVIACLTKPFKPLLEKLRNAGSLQQS